MEEFENHMLGTTDADLKEWYGEKYAKDWVTETKTMAQADIDKLLTEFKTDVAINLAEETDSMGLSAREWLRQNTDRALNPASEMDDILAGLEQSNTDMFPEEVAEQLSDEDFFNKNIQPKIDDYYADLAAREPDVDKVNSYYESLSQADQGMIDNYYDNLITDSQVINIADNKVTGKVIKKTIKSRLKNLLIGGVDALDMYELGLIGMALVEPAVEKALQPLMPMIIPGYKGKVDSKTYGQQVMENLQTTAKISPTAKVSETIANIPQPQTQQFTGMGWVGKMLDR